MKTSVSLWMLIIVLFTAFALPSSISASTGDQGINEKLGLPIVVYGEALSESQKSDVIELLEVDQHDQVDEFTVNGQDLANYIGGNPNSNMYSSVKIIHQDNGAGLNIDIVTPDNITQVTKEMYTNALLTAGVENADVLVASSVKVSGHSALTGIYKAYDAKGVKLDEERMKVASDELDIATDIAEEEGMDRDKISELLTEIKKEIAEQDPATREEIEQIVQDQLQSLNIELSEEDRQRLIDLFEQMRSLNINFDHVRNQLEDLTGNIQDLVNDEGFWNNLRTTIRDFFKSLSDFIRSLFN
ncbi:Uncharacterized protein YpuA, DUF1002 family [Halobacillus karajensis]|uniref:Secreted protein n=1 Tax=Halobacillus karajensis TaxID=195088 RepID=A0A024P9I2_9BACI|nr:DUF1002 domain-containing protein [Halobacillus karajensis]CDQ21583.1 putative secreted protein [Halobacillus karajensis]CDQ25518.1 putative secreted protein [Halobacillus karajensis]CDQ28952.1 putative secreted protein [Halobacillus karajensis]SEI08750.1 Uncharacterized protein YpuA, DUF1002 family [Halobacillus karajensis]